MDRKKAIIFGSNGQDGFYLKQVLNIKDIDVITVSRSNSDCNGDIKDFNFVNSLIVNNYPDFIFHLAANSTAKHEALFDNHDAISTGTINVLESVYKNKLSTKIFITGSGLQFKNTGNPINENSEFEALNPYSASRIYSVYMARYYRTLGLKVYIGYLFNHESSFRKDNYISKKIVNSIKEIKNGLIKTVEVGNINIEKEWTYAGDIAEAILMLVNQDNVYEAVIGSGITYSIKEWIEVCFSLENLNWTDFIIEDKNFISNYKKLVSDPDLMKSLGWKPKVNLKQLAELMINNKN